MTFTIRRGTPADSYAVFEVFEYSLADLMRRFGSTTPTSASDPAKLAKMWENRRSLYEHLAHTAEQFWIAERDGKPVGFSRSICRDGVLELTEFFILPGEQSQGLGRELLARSFPSNGGRNRSIIASPDVRAQALYLKSGVYPYFPIYYFGKTPENAAYESDLSFQPLSPTPESLVILGDIDQTILGHRRDVDHRWFARERQGTLYYRDGRPVGYGYLGKPSGPFALLDSQDFPAALSHAESAAAEQNYSHFGLEVPMNNHPAVDHLLARRFKMEPFPIFFMANELFGKLENYIITSPPFFL